MTKKVNKRYRDLEIPASLTTKMLSSNYYYYENNNKRVE